MDRPVFVARERQLEGLNSFLQRALSGEGAVCFVRGEAGSGKTTLVGEFNRRALAENEDLVVAVGQSDAQTGVGDPYLPFREILAQLTGDVDAKLTQGAITQENAGRLRRLLAYSGQAVVELGPDLIGVFIPGAGLATRAAAFLAERAGWLDGIEKLTQRPASIDEAADSGIQQSYIFEQYTNVLNKLAEKSPLVLVLDDLQWADAASIGLLFRLGRRIENSRVMVLGTYRPEEVALGRRGERHPLEEVLAEFKRYYGDIWIDLDRVQEDECRHFLEAFLDSEPNLLGSSFRQALYHHTHGHPLFTVELLRDMQETGDLVQDAEGRWVESPSLNWNDLPDRVEGVIEGRIGRLEVELQNTLAVGSVQGEDFTAEVVARVQQADERGLVRQLSGELEKRHRLVQARGVERLEGHRLSLYRFQHNLFQKYLYGNLDQVERSYMHEDVGNVLETLYGDRTDEIAVQLARHFEEAQLPDKAVHYLKEAGDQAAVKFANDEAVDYFSRALDLNPQEDLANSYDLLLRREKIYDLQGNREAQGQDIADLEALASQLGDDQRRMKVILRRANYACVTDDYPAAADAAQEGVQLAEEIQDLDGQATGTMTWGSALSSLGDSESARAKYQQALEIRRQMGDLKGEAGALNNLGTVADNFDDYSLAKSYYTESLRIARQIGDRLTELRTLNNLGLLASTEGDLSQAKTYYEQSLAILKKVGFRKGEGVLIQNIGILHARQGEFGAAMDYFEHARGISHQVGDRYSEARLLENLGCAAAEQGDFSSARSYFQRGLELFQDLGIQHSSCSTLYNLACLYLELGDMAQAKTLTEEALEIARQIDTPHYEGCSLNCLGDIAAALGEYGKAIEMNQRALEIQREIEAPSGEAAVLGSLGRVLLQCGDFEAAKGYIEGSLRISSEIGNRRGEGRRLDDLGSLSHRLAESEAALDYLDQALDLTREVSDRVGEAYSLTHRGHVLAELGRFEESARAYQEALNIRRDLGQRHLAMEPLAGLARVSLARGDLAQAESHVHEILEYLDGNTLDGVEDRFQIYLTCCRVLDALGDPRAQELLTDAYRLLQEQTAGIQDDALRESFLTKVPSHRQLTQEYEALTG